MENYGQGWRADARCGAFDVDPELFFPIGISSRTASRQAAIAMVTLICLECPVAEQCHADAEAANAGTGERYGIRAGVDRQARGYVQVRQRKSFLLRQLAMAELAQVRADRASIDHQNNHH